MNIVTICISFIVSILGVAFPILLQVISKLDEKYTSVHISRIFENEKSYKTFKIALYTSLGAILLYIIRILFFNSLRFISEVFLTFFVSSLLVIVTIILIVSFLFFVNKILSYYNPYKIVEYFIKRDRNSDKKGDFLFFNAITDLMSYSIKKQNETIAHTITDYFHDRFYFYQNINPQTPIEYPYDYYLMIYKIAEQLVYANLRKFAFVEVRTIGGIWLLGELKDYKIHENTYVWIWRTIVLAVQNNRDDMVLQYWGHAHQYYTFNLSELMHPGSESNGSELKKRREKFREFHYALGGLLLFSKKTACIKRIFNYTTSMPPRYELLPETMTEIFIEYYKFLDPNNQNFSWITTQYYFPDLEGYSADSTVKYWICRYIGLLLIRQYSIVPYLTFMKPLELPHLPDKLIQKRRWLDNINSFKKHVSDLYVDEEIKIPLGFGFITDEYCLKYSLPTPLDIVDKTQLELQSIIEKTNKEQTVSNEKKAKFFESSKRILQATLDIYTEIWTKQKLSKDFNKWFINGISATLDKAAFAKESETEWMDYDTILAESLSERLINGITETFLLNQRNSFIIKEDELFNAIDRLKINPKDHIIISYLLDFNYIVESKMAEGLTDHGYKDIELHNFTSFNYNQLGESIYILKKSDLPKIIFHSPTEEITAKFGLEIIDQGLNLFGNIIDLYRNENLLKELSKDGNVSDLEKKVYLYLFLNAEIRWKRDVKMISVRKHDPYKRDNGLVNNLKDVKSFRHIFKQQKPNN